MKHHQRLRMFVMFIFIFYSYMRCDCRVQDTHTCFTPGKCIGNPMGLQAASTLNLKGVVH